MKVWKYEIKIHGEFEHEIPEEAKLLCVKEQNGKPYMWLTVPTNINRTRKFKYVVVMTGEEYDQDTVGQYIGSFQLTDKEERRYVGHLFRRGV